MFPGLLNITLIVTTNIFLEGQATIVSLWLVAVLLADVLLVGQALYNTEEIVSARA